MSREGFIARNEANTTIGRRKPTENDARSRLNRRRCGRRRRLATAPAPALPPPEQRCERLLAAAAAFKPHDARDNATPPESPLAVEVSRLVRSEGGAAARLAVACADAAGSAAHAAAARGLEGLDAVARLFPALRFLVHAGKEAKTVPKTRVTRLREALPNEWSRDATCCVAATRAASRRWRWRRGAGTRAWRILLRGGADPDARRLRRRRAAQGGRPRAHGCGAAHPRGRRRGRERARRRRRGERPEIVRGGVAGQRCTSLKPPKAGDEETHGAPDARGRASGGDAPAVRRGPKRARRSARRLCTTRWRRATPPARGCPRARRRPKRGDAAGRTPRDALELSSARAGCNRGLLRDILRTKGAV